MIKGSTIGISEYDLRITGIQNSIQTAEKDPSFIHYEVPVQNLVVLKIGFYIKGQSFPVAFEKNLHLTIEN